jgi:hypothetical protein
MLRYKLRTLLIFVAVAPPVLAGTWWGIQHRPEECLAIVLTGGFITLVAYGAARLAANATKR